MSNHRNISIELVHKFNDTSRNLDDIFFMDKPDFGKHISNIYPTELQYNKANAGDNYWKWHNSVYKKSSMAGTGIL